MKFPYKKLAPNVQRPIIPVEIGYGGRSVKYEALVDSGADCCIFDAQIAEVLGIQLRTGKYKTVGGINGGQSPYYEHIVTIIVGGWPVETVVGFMPDYKAVHSVLGQRGFFSEYSVKFDYTKSEVELKSKPKKED